MKKHEILLKEVIDEINSKSLTNVTGISLTAKIRKQVKRFVYITSLVGIGLLFNSCIGGYIVAEPSYVVVSRPPQPSSLHIWIDGDWVWSRQSNTYVQRNGYWEQPKQNRTWVPGYWQTSPRGQYWTAGHWQKQNYKSNKGHGRNKNR